MKLLYTNAQSLSNSAKLTELNLLLLENNPDILAITETWLNENSPIKIWNDYVIFRKDRSNRIGGGVLLAVLKDLCPVPEQIISPPGCDSVAVSCQDSTGSYITIVSFYCPPDTDLDCNFLSSLEAKYPKLLICGDFNAKHPIWGFSDQSNPKGKALADFCELSELLIINTLFPKEPTFYLNQQNYHYDVLDLLIASPSLARSVTSFNSLDSLGSSDHTCLMATFQETVLRENQNLNKISYNFSNANWAQFSQTLDTYILQASLNSLTVFQGSNPLTWADQIDQYIASLTTRGV